MSESRRKKQLQQNNADHHHVIQNRPASTTTSSSQVPASPWCDGNQSSVPTLHYYHSHQRSRRSTMMMALNQNNGRNVSGPSTRHASLLQIVKQKKCYLQNLRFSQVFLGLKIASIHNMISKCLNSF